MTATTFIDVQRNVPASLQAGIRELADNPIRTASASGGLALTSHSVPIIDSSTTDGIAWNCVFKPSRALDRRTFRIHPQLTSSGGPESLVITVLYHPKRICNAFRALGHILATARSPTLSAAFEADKQALHSSAASSSSANPSPLSSLNSIQLALELLSHSEQAHFETIGTMIDCSRNGVLNVPSTKFLLRILALLGYNMLQLYTEDTYKIPNEPFFGYLRGGYTFQDTKDIDEYAFIFGIELVPCIQTLGHLGQVLQWPRFLSLRDTSEVLLAAPSHPPTAALVAQMLDAAMAPVRSRRIHLGMDETHGLAMGRYHQLYNARGGRDASEVFVRHLQVVQDLCQERGIKGMIWSDMLFCLHARQNSLLGYYDSAAPPTSTATSLPKETDLVFWDYYHLSSDSYRQRLKSHRDLMSVQSPDQSSRPSASSTLASTLNALRARTFSTDEGSKIPPPSAPPPKRNLWMAAGSWTWSRFWTALPFTFATVRASMSACKEARSGVDNVFLTIWGDEGNEVDLWSSLPAWTYYAEHGFRKIPNLAAEGVAQLVAGAVDEIDVDSELRATDSSAIEEDDNEEDENEVPLTAAEAEVDVDLLRAKFDAVCGGNFDDFVVASRVDDVAPEQQTVDDRIHFAPNTSKWLLWEEPFFGFVSPSSALSGVDLQQHYEALAEYLRPRIRMPSSALSADKTGGPAATGINSDGAENQDAAEVEAASPSRSSATAGPSKSRGAATEGENGETSLPNPSTHPLNARLVLPYLLAQALSLKAGLRRELHEAYRAQNWEVLRALGGRGESSRLGRLRVAVERLWRYHREMWMSMYKPFGWETVELRYGGFRTRLDTMHARIVRFLDHIDAGGLVGIPTSSKRSTPATSSTRKDGVLLDVSAAVGIDPSPVQTTPALISGQVPAWSSSAPAAAAGGSGEAGGTETLYGSEVFELPELEVELELVYGSAEQLLDYHRVSRPTYC
ncbi:hypothetical protein V8E36_005772 [Tilletia maclaganii]